MSFIAGAAAGLGGLYNADTSGTIVGSLFGRLKKRREAKKAKAMATNAAGANNQIESRLSAVEGALEELNTAASEPIVDAPSEAPVPQVSGGVTNNLKALGTMEGVFGGPEVRDIQKAQVMTEPVAPPTVQESLQDQLGKTILGI